jgi:LPXTG-motif cell wall-anchored protein
MKLRRAMAAAAATAVIAPLALLSAPAAFASENLPQNSSLRAEETESPEATESPEVTESPETTESPEATPSSPEKSTPEETPEKPAPSSSAPEETKSPEEEEEEPLFCDDNADYKSKLDAQLKGLPGKIAVGSGWHPFTLTVKNPTKTGVKDVLFYAGVGPSDPDAENAFKASQVQLQVKYNGTWFDITDDEGYSFGFLDLADISAGQTLNYQLRVNVKANAPIGEGLTIGGGLYFDEEENCVGIDQTHYTLQIVKAGTNTDGTKPQEGGRLPVPTEKPNKNNTQQVTGSLAETGSNSMVPTIGLVGGLAVVVGAGALFVVRRRKADAAA